MEQAKRVRKTRWLYGPLLLMGTLILVLLLLEIWARMLPEGTLIAEVHSCFVSPEEGASNQECNKLLREDPVLYHHPFSESYNRTKPAGTRRVIFIGDSMTAGKGVSQEKRFTTLLENLLNSQARGCQGCKSYDILNLGVNGYNLEQVEQVFYESLDFEPDLVAYNYYGDDQLLLRLDVKDDLEVVQSYDGSVPYAFAFPGNGWLLEHSSAYRFFNRKLSVIVRNVKPRFQLSVFQPSWPVVQEAFDGMIGTAKQEQVPFVIMYAPHFETSPISGADSSTGFIPSRCHSGVMIWEVSRELAPLYTPEELRISDDDTHPNELGHAAIAKALQPYFERYVLNQSALQRLIPSEDEDVPCIIV